jgi:hypothetical protein
VNADIATRTNAQANVPAADATIAQAAAAGTTAVLNDNKTLSFTFTGNTKPDQKTIDQLTAAVRTEIAAGNRAALEALTQKAKGAGT